MYTDYLKVKYLDEIGFESDCKLCTVICTRMYARLTQTKILQ